MILVVFRRSSERLEPPFSCCARVNNVHLPCLSLTHSPRTICWVQLLFFLSKEQFAGGIPFLRAFLFLQLVQEKSSKGEWKCRAGAGPPLRMALVPECGARVAVWTAHALSRGRCIKRGQGLASGSLRPLQIYVHTCPATVPHVHGQ